MLAQHLAEHEGTLAKHSTFSDYYSRRNGSPIKRERVSPSDVVVPPPRTRRRQTRVCDRADSYVDARGPVASPR